MDNGGTVLDLNDFFFFVQVVDRGGFTAAGRTLRIPKWTLSRRTRQLETNLAARQFNPHPVVLLGEAELAETAIRHRLSEPTVPVRCTAAGATMQFAMRDIVAD